MNVYVDNTGRIHSVNMPIDGLTELYIDDETNPFNGWSTLLICCYRVTVIDGRVTMMTPAVDSKLLSTFQIAGRDTDINTTDITDAQEAIAETYDSVEVNASDITDVQEAIAELFEMIAGGV